TPVRLAPYTVETFRPLRPPPAPRATLFPYTTLFRSLGRDDYAIQVYERTRTILQNPYLFTGTLTRLYGKKGDIAKAVDVLLNARSEEHTSELQSRENLVCRLLLEKQKTNLMIIHKIA